MRREMSVVGGFYPGRAVEIERYFEHFTEEYDENFKLPKIISRVVIVPHAGYMYSGYTANIAYRVLQNSGIKNFVVIGPSHRVAFEGVSMCGYDSYDTPFGEVNRADSIYKKLQEKFSLECMQSAHAEHSTEVQFPFIKHYMESVNIVELVYSHVDPEYISKIINFVLKQKSCGVIISTDLSHFYTLSSANRLDSIFISALEKLDLDKLHSGCEACGMIGVEGMMMSAKKLGMKPKVLDYRTSADVSGDEDRVVGYASACFSE